MLENDDLKAVNTATAQQVRPHSNGRSEISDGTLQAQLNKASWNVLRLERRPA